MSVYVVCLQDANEAASQLMQLDNFPCVFCVCVCANTPFGDSPVWKWHLNSSFHDRIGTVFRRLTSLSIPPTFLLCGAVRAQQDIPPPSILWAFASCLRGNIFRKKNRIRPVLNFRDPLPPPTLTHRITNQELHWSQVAADVRDGSSPFHRRGI